MKKRKQGLLGRWISDPRQAGGHIKDREIDATRAVLLGHCAVAEVIPADPGQQEAVIALELGGRISKTTEEATILFLASPDSVAMVVTELLKSTTRSSYALKRALSDRIADLKEGDSDEERDE